MDIDGEPISTDEYDTIINGIQMTNDEEHSISQQSNNKYPAYPVSPVSSFIYSARAASNIQMYTSSSLSCFQLNLHRSIVPIDNLFAEIASSTEGKDNWACLIQEPNINRDNSVSSVPSACRAYYDDTKRARAAIIVPQNSQCTFIDHLSSPDFCTVRLHRHRCVDLILCSVYMDWSSNELPPLLEKTAAFANANNIELVIGADCNAHHPFWGSKSTNKRGEILTEMLTKRNLAMLNDGSPTFHNVLRDEALDITICNKKAANSCSKWRVSDTPSLSDHSLIRFDVTCVMPAATSKDNSNARPSRTIKHRYKKSDQFVDYIEDELIHYKKFLSTPSANNNELNDKAELLVRLIDKADSKCFAKSYISIRSHNKKLSAPWWNKELSALRKKLRQADSKHKKTGSPTDHQSYKKVFGQYKRMLKNSKNENWQLFCSNNTSNPSRLLKVISKKRTPGSIQIPGRSPSSTPLGTLQALTSDAGSSLPGPSRPVTQMSTPNAVFSDNNQLEASETATDICSPLSLKRAIQSLKSKKAPGPDNVSNCMLKKAWRALEHSLLSIFHDSVRLGHIPDCWQLATGILLPKPGKRDYSVKNSWRTLNLTSSILKILEKLVKYYLEDSVNIDSTLDDSQLGFRKGKSADEALHRIVTSIESSLEKGKFALGCFIDIKAAFDSISFESIMIALQKSGVNSTLIKWIFSLLTRRKVIFHLKGASLINYILKGTPQGGILSPLLWNLVINSLLISLKSHMKPGDISQGFADDLVTLLNGNDPNELLSRQQQIIDTVLSWCEENGLELSPAKTNLVLFTWKTKFTITEEVVVNGEALKFNDNTKYLGVLLNRRLLWTPHIKAACNKGSMTLASARRFVGKRWGLDPNRALYILKAIVKPGVLYASHIWAHNMNTGGRQKLRKLQNFALRTTLFCPKFTSATAMDITTGSTSLHIEAKTHGLKTLLRLKNMGKDIAPPQKSRNLKFEPHSELFVKSAQSVTPALDSECDLIPSYSLNPPPFKIFIADEQFNEFMANFTNSGLSLADISCFTDGSQKDSKTGAGFTIFRKYRETSFHKRYWALPSLCTVFQAELSAINEACIYMQSLSPMPSSICIYSDSLSSIEALTSPSCSSQICLDTRANLDLLSSKCPDTTLCWIRAHRGIYGNEEADLLAKQGTTSTSIQIVLPPLSAFYKGLSSFKDKESSTSTQENGNEVSKLLNHFQNPVMAKFLNKLSRSKLRKLCSFIDNKAPLRYFLHKIGLASSPLCSICTEANETNGHLIFHCPGLCIQRVRSFGHMFPNSEVIAAVHPAALLEFVLCLPMFSNYVSEE